MAILSTSKENSLNVGIYYSASQIGFTRLITDYATFAVYILEEYQDDGIGRWRPTLKLLMMCNMMNINSLLHPHTRNAIL